MKIVDVFQGSDEWKALRASKFCASEASAMMGVGMYKTRSALISEKATGVVPDVSVAQQRLFDKGHAAEDAARPIVEKIIGEELFPVTCVDGRYLASLDGLSMSGDVLWEQKLLNESLVEQVKVGKLHPHYAFQLEHQLMVTGAGKAYFTTSDGTEENTFGMWYVSDQSMRKALIAGWDQFEIDVAEYQHVHVKPKPDGVAPDTLPALRIEVTGAVTFSNLDEFKSHALAVIGGIKTDLQCDQDFADAEKTVKWLKDVEDRLRNSKQRALEQTESIDALFRAVDDIMASAASTRLKLDKMVKSEKETRKLEIVLDAQAKLDEHVSKLNIRTDRMMPKVNGDFGGVIRGLKSLDSMRDRVSAALAMKKIEANDIADRIAGNVKSLTWKDNDWRSLFPDLDRVCNKAPEDFAALLASRIAAYHDAKAKREEARVAAESKHQEVPAEASARPVVAPITSQTDIEPRRPNAPLVCPHCAGLVVMVHGTLVEYQEAA